MKTQEITLILSQSASKSQEIQIASKLQVTQVIKDMGYTIISIDSEGVNAEKNGIQTKIRLAKWKKYS